MRVCVHELNTVDMTISSYEYQYNEMGVTNRWQLYIKPPRQCTKFDAFVASQKPSITLNDLQVHLMSGINHTIDHCND